MSTRRLRAVQEGESAKPVKPKSVTQAAKGGVKRELLVAMRDRVATAVEDPATPARDLAALTRRLVEIADRIEAIDAHEEDELAAEVEDGDFDASAV